MARFNLEDYEQVEDRLRAFHAEHAEGQIVTELVDHVAGEWYIVKALVWRDLVADGRLPDATGYAHEQVVKGHPVNEHSALENCETSAIGRALANLGYAAKGKRPSREEMTKASAPVSDSPSAGADTAGEGSAQPSSATTYQYPVKPEACDHKRNTGRPANIVSPDKVERCGKCGLPWIVVVEGAVADLGPAVASAPEQA